MAPTLLAGTDRSNPLDYAFAPNYSRKPPRWESTNDNRRILIFADGAAPNNGRPDVRAGCGVAAGPSPISCCSFRLEPDAFHQLTNNRAELRAVEGAIKLDWKKEGIETIVIATDSEYVAEGATVYIRVWRSRSSRWVVQRANMDLWDRLMKVIEDKEREGIRVEFYLIDRKWNQADRYAKAAADY
ncbi:uncharacterized protein LACBIDRAFT_297866 [Laccaria bicolor S238N-H82]|uniref:Predicted protein n=1 Tax=Laccaria bicolor (strain S238N-H82 / ATCC MYA-4686) TaxID=486041 RepID=B0DB27_LACBS|nr:uncharacterized protein LACBIDRAFT_297866 [Laccaria bicolor S238N-H82]EDR08313.1 predicted protein [Laccaria bicolor S238N-H82]|eukprot:XP_001881383.1 predicted protein [Laccaria bicolor S238N-H82]